MSEQRRLHRPIMKWLESSGISVCPDSEKMPVPIRDILPTQNYILPDIIGIRDTNEVVVVEIETSLDKILEVMGKCMIWKTTAESTILSSGFFRWLFGDGRGWCGCLAGI